MSFRKVLAELVQKVPGARGAILADYEGEAVDQAARMDDYQLKVLGAHKGVILGNLSRAIGRLEGDCLREMVVATEKSQTLVLPITADYFLVLTLERGHLLGRALFEARRCAERLRHEIA